MIDLRLGDCRDLLPTLPDASIDVVIADPPYPHVKREYGVWTEAEWWDLMRPVVAECRRILKPSGSAVFILQPNSERVGRMRPWLFDFIAWACREWNVVQDAWWWNVSAPPGGGEGNRRDLLRSSIKACIWLGDPDCFRDRDTVLWTESDDLAARRRTERARHSPGRLRKSPGGFETHTRTKFDASERRGGVTPFNLIPTDHGYSQRSAGGNGHPAGTPLSLVDWWIRYLCPDVGTVCDPFAGSGTTGLAALRRGRSFVGFEKMPEYFETARRRLAEEAAMYPLIEPVAAP